MSKHEHKEIHEKHSSNGNEGAWQAEQACHRMLESLADSGKRSARAADVVFGGMIDGAGKEARNTLRDQGRLAARSVDALTTCGVTGAIGIAARLFPPAAIVIGGLSVGSVLTETVPRLGKSLPDLGNYWNKAYAESDPKKLDYYKAQVGTRYGEATLKLGVDTLAAGIGFGGGMKAGSFIKTRANGLLKSGEAVRAPRVHVDEFGNQRVYNNDKTLDVRYADGGEFHRSAAGVPTMLYPNGQRVTEFPGVMRITDKPNGDKIYKYHGNGHTETHKPSGTIIKELPDGIIETHRKNGMIYREHPDGTAEILPIKASKRLSMNGGSLNRVNE